MQIPFSGGCVIRANCINFTDFRLWHSTSSPPEYDIVSLYMVSFYCFVTKAYARRPVAVASVELRLREHRTLLRLAGRQAS